jgi:hypothetical protein
MIRAPCRCSVSRKAKAPKRRRATASGLREVPVLSALVLTRPGHQREDERCGTGDRDGGELSEVVHAPSVAWDT